MAHNVRELARRAAQSIGQAEPIGAGVASYLGVRSRLRRQDLRVLVGCGAGGAIAAAFGAPLTGAFYAFELIIGAYSLANAIPALVDGSDLRGDGNPVSAIQYDLPVIRGMPRDTTKRRSYAPFCLAQT